MKNILAIPLLFFFYVHLTAQQDTIYEGHKFHVILYDDSARIACIGNYLQNTGIRNGEWDYFYPDGKLYARTYFKKDLKRGLWLYYNENGTIVRDVKHREKLEPKPCPNYIYQDVEQLFNEYYKSAQQNKNECIQFSHGCEPLEYDERMYPFKINAIAHYLYLYRAAEDAKEHVTRYYFLKDGNLITKEFKGKQYTNIEVKNSGVHRLNPK